MKANKNLRTLYICYFGLREPLVQTQVLTYLRQLSSDGIEVNLLTFEPDFLSSWAPEEKLNWHDRLTADGIKWFALPYHKRPSAPATVYDILAGARFVVRLIREHSIDVLHARSHIPLAIALLARARTGCRLIFDLRGLMAEEYVDSGIWQEGSAIFRAIKRLEKTGLRKANQIVVLTNRMRDWLVEQNLAGEEKIEVIPCCVDFSRLQFDENQTNQTNKSFEMVYAGSVTGRYLLEEMGRFFLALQARKPDAFFRVLTRASAKDVANRLMAVGLSEADFSVQYVQPEEIPFYLRKAAIGIFFLKPAFSQLAASPTKIPEYLASGLSVVCNAGTGDLDQLLEDHKTGIIVKEFNVQSYNETVERIIFLMKDQDLPDRCRRLAHSHFDLRLIGATGYRRVYHRIQKTLSLEDTYTAMS